MHPILNKVLLVENCSFSLQVNECKQLVYPLHYHTEYQLNFIKSGKGQRMIGNQLFSYDSGDLVLIGAEVPHFWTYDDDFYSVFGPGKTFVIHFKADFAGDTFFEKPEMARVNELLIKARGGVVFHGLDRLKASKIIEEMEFTDQSDRFIKLIIVLQILGNSNQHQLLSVIDYITHPDPKPINKINRVWELIFNNFKSEINLEQLSTEVGMSTTAFSKFFRKHTNKTYIGVIQELRIGYACKKLIETDDPITNIAFESGYNNIANFNRQFMAITGKTPSKFKREVLGEVN